MPTAHHLPSYKQATNEILPTYKPTLLYYDIVLLKKELSSPFDIAKDRSWDLAIVEINSTQLNTYKLKNLNNIQSYLWKLIDSQHSIDHKNKLRKKIISEDDDEFSNKDLIQWLLINDRTGIPHDIINPYIGAKNNSYTLQSCKIGVATDYHKKNYTLRLRIELHQLLISFININKFNKFFNNILIGIDLSIPLDERSLPKEKTVPNEISRFRIQNFQNYYMKNCWTSTNENLSVYRRHTIDHTSLELTRDEFQNQLRRQRANSICFTNSSNSSIMTSDLETSMEKPPSYDTSNEFIDENLIYSLTCIKSLEAKAAWKGKMTITGDYKNKSITKFMSKKSNSSNIYSDKIFVNNQSCKKFGKIITDVKQNHYCKEFVVLEDGLVESV